MTHASKLHIPLSSAYLCQDCSSVGNSSKQCPACASSVLMALAVVLDRGEEATPAAVLEFRSPIAA